MVNLNKNIILVSGSLRKNSFNTKILKNFKTEISKFGYNCDIVDLNQYTLPFYNEDLEKVNLPKNLSALKQLFQNSTGLIVASPEYNGEISAVLKNTFDWLSRKLPGEVPKQSFSGLKAIAVTSSTGKNGGMRALERLKILLSRLGVKDEILSFSLANTSDEIFDKKNNILIEEQIFKIRNLVEYFITDIEIGQETTEQKILKVS